MSTVFTPSIDAPSDILCWSETSSFVANTLCSDIEMDGLNFCDSVGGFVPGDFGVIGVKLLELEVSPPSGSFSKTIRLSSFSQSIPYPVMLVKSPLFGLGVFEGPEYSLLPPSAT